VRVRFAIVRKGLALSPEGWRLFVQQSVENNLLLGATPAQGQVAHLNAPGARLRDFPETEGGRRSQRAGTMSGGERQMLDGRPRLDERSETLDAGTSRRWASRPPWSSRCTKHSAGCTAKA